MLSLSPCTVVHAADTARSTKPHIVFILTEVSPATSSKTYTDLSEETNLARQNPGKVKELFAALKADIERGRSRQ